MKFVIFLHAMCEKVGKPEVDQFYFDFKRELSTGGLGKRDEVNKKYKLIVTQ